MPRICVIGAGPCGLTTLHALVEHGLEVDCLERQDGIGGNWYYGSPHSNMYASATMISSKRMTEFPSRRMPGSFPHYPSHSQVLSYLQDFTDHFGLGRFIQLQTSVEKISRAGDRWQVKVAGETAPRDYDAVVIAAGHHTSPNLPDLASRFTGQVIHSRDYRVPDPFVGKRVLVVGAGNSGCDIAAELGRHAAHCSISLRRGYHFLPKFLCGAPIDRCGETMAKFRLPWFLWRAITTAFLRVAVGPLERYGLPRPLDRLFESHPIVNSQLLEAIGHGRVHVRHGLRSIVGPKVIFEDGWEAEFDVLLCATGYQMEWPFLAPTEFDVRTANELPLRLFHPDFNGLFFSGLIQPNGAIWSLAELQGQLIAKVLLAQHGVAGNSQASAETQQKLRSAIVQTGTRGLTGGLKYHASPRHAIEVEYFAYRKTLRRLLRLAEQLGIRPVEQGSSALAEREMSPSAELLKSEV